MQEKYYQGVWWFYGDTIPNRNIAHPFLWIMGAYHDDNAVWHDSMNNFFPLAKMIFGKSDLISLFVRAYLVRVLWPH